VGDINTLILSTAHPDSQKINKETLNFTIDQMDLTDTCRMFHPIAMGTHSSQQPMDLSLK
jgi:hypothetical protein